MSRREVIQMISDIGQASSYVQEDNHLDCLIWVKWLPNMKRHGQVINSQAMTTERSHICVSQQYCWHMMIEADWEDLRRTNSPRDIFTHFAHYFQLNLDEISFLCNEGELKVLGSKDKPHHDKYCSESRFLITVLWVGSAAGVNGPVIFLENGTKVQPRLRGTNLVTRYELPEGSYEIPNKEAYMDDETWAKEVKAVAPSIRKMKVSNVVCVFPILFSIYLTIHLCPSKLSSDDF